MAKKLKRRRYRVQFSRLIGGVFTPMTEATKQPDRRRDWLADALA